MVQHNHNNNTQEFFKKLLVFIDTVLVNATAASQHETNKVLVDGILNARDAIFSEVIKDNQIDAFNKALHAEKAKKNQQVESLKNLNQEKALEKDQSQ